MADDGTKGGRWGNTQENAWVMEALVVLPQKHESEAPDFTAVVSLGDQSVATAAFKGRRPRPSATSP
ncbi:MAG: hypothetical protein U0Q12_01140 [Vicinamibacterales bacterium]